MGLKYVSSDSSNLMTALEQNITQIKSEMATLSTGASQLVSAVDGRTLSGAAYTAASGLFSECILPAIQKTKSAVDAIQTDLSSYKTQDGTVSGEGILDEDELNKQLNSLKSQKASAEIYEACILRGGSRKNPAKNSPATTAAFSPSLGRKCAYTSSVFVAVACPNLCCTTLIDTPRESNCVAWK